MKQNELCILCAYSFTEGTKLKCQIKGSRDFMMISCNQYLDASDDDVKKKIETILINSGVEEFLI